MPDSAEQPATPVRTWRPMIFWSSGIVLALGLVWFVAAVVVPGYQACRIVNSFCEEVAPPENGPASPWPIEARNIVAKFGGEKLVATRLRLYLRLPDLMARRKAEATAVLAACGEYGALVLFEVLATSGDETKFTYLEDVDQFSERNVLRQPDVIRVGLPRLDRFLDVWDSGTRLKAVRVLAFMGPAAIPALEKASSDRDDRVRTAAAEALKKIRGEEPPK